MSNEVELSLPQRSGGGGNSGRLQTILLGVIIVVSITAAALIVFLRPESGSSTVSLSAAALQELALKLERGNLAVPAAEAWEEYLGWIPAKDRAAIWYRIGKLYEDAGEYSRAVAAYYRSEAWHKDEELAFEIGRRIEESLERLGSFAALRYELADRVGVDASEDDVVLAEIGPEKITKADLDRRIENLIGDQLAPYRGIVSEDDLTRERERLFKQYATPEQRAALLSQYLAEELLYRYARSEDLTEDLSIRDRIIRSERGILASAILQREVSQQVVTNVDLENFYTANRESFRVPERVRLSHIALETYGDAESIRERAASGADFTALAREYSIDENTAETGGEIGWVSRDDEVAQLGNSVEAKAAVFGTTAGSVADTIVTSPSGYHVVKVLDREESRIPPLDEIRQQVFEALYARKSQEIQTQLIESLQKRYNVVIHQNAVADE